MENQKKCIVCERTSSEVPVVSFYFGEKEFGICPQHLPVLIHKPAQLADKLPGIEKMGAFEGHDH